jgi:hypothetical protein
VERFEKKNGVHLSGAIWEGVHHGGLVQYLKYR